MGKGNLVVHARALNHIANNSFKKAASRAGTQLMQKTGAVERTVDPEFAEQEGRYRTYVCCCAFRTARPPWHDSKVAGLLSSS